ncbi:MAG TPA: helix-turn-helix domain-containing protein, partial [bacterium]|nr:helix-turn-helix domain-containing protein [bacterium]
MTTKMLNEFKPDYNAHPGFMLSEIAAARGIMKMELARRVGLEEKTMSQILNGKAPIETETAIALERVLGIPAETWSALSANYKLRKKREESAKRLSGFVRWADQFPVKELVERGMMAKPSSKTDAVEKILGFFGVSSPESLDDYLSRLRILYRRSPTFQS